MRLDEITANLKEQITLSGYADKLGAGLIITGGASQLKNMDDYLTQKLDMPVRKAAAKKSLINNSPDLVSDPSFTRVLGMLLIGNEDCELQVIEPKDYDAYDDEPEVASKPNRAREKRKESPKSKKQKNTKEGGGFLSNMENFFGNMFSDDDE